MRQQQRSLYLFLSFLLVATAGLTVAATSSDANLVSNPSFELPGGAMVTVPPGNAYITGWTVTRGRVVYVSNYFTCSDGVVCIDLGGAADTVGGVSQTIGTTAGAAYTLSFDFAGNPDNAPNVKTMRVLIGGDASDFSFDVNGKTRANMGWVTKTITFTANSSSTAIEFYDTNQPGYWGPVIDNIKVVAVPPASCTYSLSATSVAIAGSGGTGSVNVTSGAGCAWNANTNANWITVTGAASGTGSGTVTYSVTANTGTARTGTLTIAGQTFTVNQAASNSGGTGYWQYVRTETYVKPYSGAYPDTSVTGGEGSLTVVMQEPSVSGPPTLGSTFTWNNPPVTLIPGAVIDWPITATVTQNIQGRSLLQSLNSGFYPYAAITPLSSASLPATRSAGSVYTYSSTPVGTVVRYNEASQPQPATMPPSLNATAPGTWADANGMMSWLVWVGSSQVYYWNYIYQWVPGAPASCTYSLNASAASIGAAAATGSVNVITSSGCTWNASSNATWITITAGTRGTGNGTVSYSVTANSGVARAGTLTIGGQTFTVNQAASGSSSSPSVCTGTCSLGVPGQPISSSGGPGSVSVTATSSWTVVAVDNWIHLTSPTSNSGNLTATFTIDPNTGPPRQGIISIAGQPYAIYQNGTPAGTTTGCAYLVQSAITQNVPASGTTSGLIQVITAQSCSWTPSTTTAWITLRSGTNVTGNGSVAYTVPENTGDARSGGIIIAGQYVVINQAAGSTAPPPGTPVISAGGIVNTASYVPGAPPSGSLAQGSFFSIYGSGIGADTPSQASFYPLPTTLGGVTVQITQGAITYKAYLVFVYKNQINAILPSSIPEGTAQVTISFNGLTSQPSTITVARTSLGVFFQQTNGSPVAIAQNVKSATDYPLNLPSTPAKPGQIVILWATGMGPISGADNVAPGAGDMTGVPVTITVGGVAAQRLYAGRQPDAAGVDNVYFSVPANAPYGCVVPVGITAGGVAANTTNIAITPDGSPCQ